MPVQRDWSRREVLKASVAASLAPALKAPAARAESPTPADPERIRLENERPGTRDWMATKVQVDPKTKYRSPWIEGYASKTFARAKRILSRVPAVPRPRPDDDRTPRHLFGLVFESRPPPLPA